MLIFLSHASVDKAIARRLKAVLESHELAAWLDEASIRPGQSIPEEIATAIKGAGVLCILLSHATRNSAWVKRELNAFVPRWISGDASIVPCRLEPVELPTILSDIKYADFSESFDTGVEQLLQGVRIRESVELCAQVETARGLLLSRLQPVDIAFLVHYFSRSSSYFFNRTGGATYPMAIDAFESVGGLELLTDRRERDYSLTEKGKHLVRALEKDAPNQLLEKWDREIGPRK
jgi:hypothetical protein